MPSSEVDALANMMGADSRRIDGLVQDVSEVKGDVRSMKGNVDRAVKGIDELIRHSVLMEGLAASDKARQAENRELDQRLQKVEQVLPSLIESRQWQVRAILGVLAVVGLAIVGLVIKIQAVT